MKALCCTVGGSRGLVGAVAMALALALAAPTQARTWYAANNGLDDNQCTKTAPCRSVTKTMAVASEGDTITVGPGLYGDLNRDGVLGNSAGEEPSGATGAMIDVTKRLTIISSDGAWSTVLDANGGATIAVVIDASGTVFGKPNKGFSIRNQRAPGFTGFLVSFDVSGVTVQGNVAELNQTGFHIVGGTVVKGNIAVANDSGFHILGTASVTGNLARGNVFGFSVDATDGHPASGVLVGKNIASGNDSAGFRISCGPAATGPLASFASNTAVGNGFCGVLVEMDGAFSGPVSIGGITANNVFGNDASTNCGLFISNGDTNHNSLTVTATGNFWGAASGPGPDPADTAGTSACISSAGGAVTVVTAPVATKQFKLSPPKIK